LTKEGGAAGRKGLLSKAADEGAGMWGKGVWSSLWADAISLGTQKVGRRTIAMVKSRDKRRVNGKRGGGGVPVVGRLATGYT